MQKSYLLRGTAREAGDPELALRIEGSAIGNIVSIIGGSAALRVTGGAMESFSEMASKGVTGCQLGIENGWTICP